MEDQASGLRKKFKKKKQIPISVTFQAEEYPKPTLSELRLWWALTKDKSVRHGIGWLILNRQYKSLKCI